MSDKESKEHDANQRIDTRQSATSGISEEEASKRRGGSDHWMGKEHHRLGDMGDSILDPSEKARQVMSGKRDEADE